MGRPEGRSIDIEFSKNPSTIFTGRAGLVPLFDVAKAIKLPQAIDQACAGVRNDSYTSYKSSQLVLFGMAGHFSGLHRIDSLLKSSECDFISKLVDFKKSTPAGTTFARLYEGFEEQHIQNFKNINFDLATKNITEVSGHQIIVHDQSAIQKYGKQMEGVEKGYGGTLKKGSSMLQCSLIVDAGQHTILSSDIRPGSTHSYNNAANELNEVLDKLPQQEPGKQLILADSAYGVGEYMRICDKHNAHFILAVKNDSWMKNELDVLDFQRFNRGKDSPGYGYREFMADRKSWNGTAPNSLFGDEWDGTRRVIVVRLPSAPGEEEKFQFLITSFSHEQHSAEEIHALYRVNRESIELINDEIKNQLGLSELPSRHLDANRAVAQIICLAWNLQRHIEHVGMATERKNENNRRKKTQATDSTSGKFKRRFEWRTMFNRFISIGGKLKTGGNKLSVIVAYNTAFNNWMNNLNMFDWKKYCLVR